MKNLLVIAFYYPPMIRVGGRRWFLFVKYLRRLGINVSVLTFADIGESQGKDSRDLIFVLGKRLAHLPYFKRTLPNNLLQKILWKASFYADQIHRQFISYDQNDHSYGSVNEFYAKAKLAIARGIDTVVLTVGPFSYSSILTTLKRDFPHVKFILDYRDDRFRDKEKLTPRQLRGEQIKERNALDAADLVLTVDENIANILSSSHSGLTTPIRVLPHGYDEDDFKDLAPTRPNPEAQKVKLVYGGACYNGVSNYYKLLAQFLETNKSQIASADLYFTALFRDVEEILKDADSVRLMPPVSRQEMLKVQTTGSDINLVIYPKTNFNARSSKFYELIRCGRPILYFGPDGPTAQFIRDRNLGMTITDPKDLQKVDLNALRTRAISTPDLSENSFETLTGEFTGMVGAISA